MSGITLINANSSQQPMIGLSSYGILIWLLVVKPPFNMNSEFMQLFGILLTKASSVHALEIRPSEFGMLDLAKMSKRFMLIQMKFCQLISISMKTSLHLLALMEASDFGYLIIIYLSRI